MNFHIITLFPGMFDSYVNESIIKRAQEEGKIKIKFYNPRDYVKPTKKQSEKKKPYLRVDDKPYGGGPGMVMEAMPLVKAIEKAIGKKTVNPSKRARKKIKILFFSPGGELFTTEKAKAWTNQSASVIRVAGVPATRKSKITDIIMVCGRYEGVDERVNKIFKTEKVSVGPYVLTGGELPAMILIDSISRQIEGVLGNFSSLEESRISSNETYTRPEVLVYKKRKYRVPKVLLSGDHKKIEAWRQNKN